MNQATTDIDPIAKMAQALIQEGFQVGATSITVINEPPGPNSRLGKGVATFHRDSVDYEAMVIPAALIDPFGKELTRLAALARDDRTGLKEDDFYIISPSRGKVPSFPFRVELEHTTLPPAPFVVAALSINKVVAESEKLATAGKALVSIFIPEEPEDQELMGTWKDFPEVENFYKDCLSWPEGKVFIKRYNELLVVCVVSYENDVILIKILD